MRRFEGSDDVIMPIYVSPITFYWNVIETWGRFISVRLVKTHLLICNLTYLGQFMTMTLGDPRSKLPSDLSGSQSI